VLSEQHLEDQQRAHSNKAANKTATAAAFAATGSTSANGDPRRFSRAVCNICGKKGHTADACFQNADATCERSKEIAPLNTALGRRVASEKRGANSKTRRSSRVPPRTTRSPTPATAPWAGSPEGADAAIAYATGVDDDAADDGFCYSAVGDHRTPTRTPHPPHMMRRRSDLTDFRPCGDSIAGIDGTVQRCQGMGTLEVLVQDRLDQTVALKIRNVRLVPRSNLSLLSASQLLADGYEIALRAPAHLKTPHAETLPLRTARGLFFLTARRTYAAAARARSETCTPADARAGKLGITPGPYDDTAGLAATFRAAHDAHSSTHVAALTTDAAATVMARRLHIGIKTMRRLPSFTADAPPSLAKVRTNPSTTTAATMKRLSHVESRYVESTPGRLFHMDICGPLPESKLGRFRYAMVLVDDSTRFKMGITLRSRDEAGTHIRRFISRFNSLASHSQGRISKVGTLLTDGAREFLSHAVQHLLDEHGVNKIEAPPEVHALNGVAERAILSIFTQVRARAKQRAQRLLGRGHVSQYRHPEPRDRRPPRSLQLLRRSYNSATAHNEHPTVGLPRLGADAGTHTLETRRQCTGGYQSRALGEATREFPHLDPATAPHSKH